jgi:hypothetical protein
MNAYWVCVSEADVLQKGSWFVDERTLRVKMAEADIQAAAIEEGGSHLVCLPAHT